MANEQDSRVPNQQAAVCELVTPRPHWLNDPVLAGWQINFLSPPTVLRARAQPGGPLACGWNAERCLRSDGLHSNRNRASPAGSLPPLRSAIARLVPEVSVVHKGWSAFHPAKKIIPKATRSQPGRGPVVPIDDQASAVSMFFVHASDGRRFERGLSSNNLTKWFHSEYNMF